MTVLLAIALVSAGTIIGIVLMGLLQAINLDEEPIPPHPERRPVFYDQDADDDMRVG